MKPRWLRPCTVCTKVFMMHPECFHVLFISWSDLRRMSPFQVCADVSFRGSRRQWETVRPPAAMVTVAAVALEVFLSDTCLSQSSR